MAHGLPDFYRGVDIAYQALAQLINRPMYGGVSSAVGGQTVLANTDTELASVYGKGMLYGGYLFLDHTSTQKDSRANLIIDDESVSNLKFSDMNKYSLSLPLSSIIHLLKFDDTNFIYSVGISYGITFETSVKIIYTEAHNSTPIVYTKMIYGLI